MKQAFNKSNNEFSKTSTTDKKFVQQILDTLSIQNLKDKIDNKFIYQLKHPNIDIQLEPDFIIENSKIGKTFFNSIDNLILKCKTIQLDDESDWETIESTFGFYEYFYNQLIGFKSKTIVILLGDWKKIPTDYFVFINYLKHQYGENCIFDFGLNYDEIIRFSKFMDVQLTQTMIEKIKEIWNNKNKILN